MAHLTFAVSPRHAYATVATLEGVRVAALLREAMIGPPKVSRRELARRLAAIDPKGRTADTFARSLARWRSGENAPEPENAALLAEALARPADTFMPRPTLSMADAAELLRFDNRIGQILDRQDAERAEREQLAERIARLEDAIAS